MAVCSGFTSLSSSQFVPIIGLCQIIWEDDTTMKTVMELLIQHFHWDPGVLRPPDDTIFGRHGWKTTAVGPCWRNRLSLLQNWWFSVARRNRLKGGHRHRVTKFWACQKLDNVFGRPSSQTLTTNQPKRTAAIHLSLQRKRPVCQSRAESEFYFPSFAVFFPPPGTWMQLEMDGAEWWCDQLQYFVLLNKEWNDARCEAVHHLFHQVSV